jgi:hypothetical protein
MRPNSSDRRLTSASSACSGAHPGVALAAQMRAALARAAVLLAPALCRDFSVVGAAEARYVSQTPNRMRYLTGMIAIGGHITWQLFTNERHGQEPGITVNFPLFRQVRHRDALRFVAGTLREQGVDWLTKRGDSWFLDLDKVKHLASDLVEGFDWAHGTHAVTLDVFDEVPTFREKPETRVQFILTQEQATVLSRDRIFLSHKGIDKPRVRDFKQTLEAVGLKPWIDEDAMPAGTNLERGILQGFKASCAAVFFVTPAFVDSGFLGSEVDYAIAEKRAKGDRFSIITLVLDCPPNAKPPVPDLLHSYVWKEPRSDLEALREIVRALPLEVLAAWKAG